MHLDPPPRPAHGQVGQQSPEQNAEEAPRLERRVGDERRARRRECEGVDGVLRHPDDERHRHEVRPGEDQEQDEGGGNPQDGGGVADEGRPPVREVVGRYRLPPVLPAPARPGLPARKRRTPSRSARGPRTASASRSGRRESRRTRPPGPSPRRHSSGGCSSPASGCGCRDSRRGSTSRRESSTTRRALPPRANRTSCGNERANPVPAQSGSRRSAHPRRAGGGASGRPGNPRRAAGSA